MHIRWGRLILTMILTIYALYCVVHRYDSHIIDGANLLIHEAGHLVLSPFGEFVSVMGGTLFQLAIPALFMFYFWSQGQRFECFILFLWLGESLIQASIYAGDAIAMRLDLLGGSASIHDWNYMLSHVGLLQTAPTIAGALFFTGIAAILGGTILAAYESLFSASIENGAPFV